MKFQIIPGFFYKTSRTSCLNLSYFFPFLLLCFSSCGTMKKSEFPKNKKPNILLINIDDLGFKDVSFNGSNFYETPNIDALAKQGVVFTNGYASAANCAPSRASLMTGLWPQRHGIITVATSERGNSKDRKLIPIKNVLTLSEKFEILPEILQTNGYNTLHAGKWHLSESPLNHGFDINIGGNHDGHPKSYYPPYQNVEIEEKEGERLTDAITSKVLSFIENSNESFFINYAPYAVHTPIQPVTELIKKYEEKPKIDSGANNVHYATMVENMDWNVGRIINVLKKTNKIKNTLIVFTSDNGGLFSVSHQHPLRAGKGSYYEGGIRVPFVFVWKGVIPENKIESSPISNLDLLPTFLASAGIEADKTFDGINLLPLLTTNNKQAERNLFWHFPVYLEASSKSNENRDSLFRTRPGSVIRKGKWKLHHYFEDNGIELYNLEEDISENNNLSNEYSQVVKELYKELDQWRNETNAPIPNQLNPHYEENENQ